MGRCQNQFLHPPITRTRFPVRWMENWQRRSSPVPLLMHRTRPTTLLREEPSMLRDSFKTRTAMKLLIRPNVRNENMMKPRRILLRSMKLQKNVEGRQPRSSMRLRKKRCRRPQAVLVKSRRKNAAPFEGPSLSVFFSTRVNPRKKWHRFCLDCQAKALLKEVEGAWRSCYRLSGTHGGSVLQPRKRSVRVTFGS